MINVLLVGVNMSVKNRKMYGLWLNPEDTEYLREFIKTTPGQGGLSSFVNQYIEIMARVARESGYKPAVRPDNDILQRMVDSAKKELKDDDGDILQKMVDSAINEFAGD